MVVTTSSPFLYQCVRFSFYSQQFPHFLVVVGPLILNEEFSLESSFQVYNVTGVGFSTFLCFETVAKNIYTMNFEQTIPGLVWNADYVGVVNRLSNLRRQCDRRNAISQISANIANIPNIGRWTNRLLSFLLPFRYMIQVKKETSTKRRDHVVFPIERVQVNGNLCKN